jgi:hypothetical protein
LQLPTGDERDDVVAGQQCARQGHHRVDVAVSGHGRERNVHSILPERSKPTAAAASGRSHVQIA